jgi:pyruvate/2-oxoglutarate dehydrogenase complex dihydrolipoamide acyltransferase (E2) component
MIYQLTIPSMGGIEELRVLQWHRREGEQVETDQLLLELETDKAVVEVRSPRPCVLRKIGVEQGGWAPVGPAIAWFSDGSAEALDASTSSDFMAQWEVL